MNRTLLCQYILMSLKKFLESEDFLDEFREPNRFVRKRILSMKNMILFLIFHPKKTLDVSWESFRKKFKPQLKLPVVSRQALSKARTGIKPELFREFFDFAVESYYAHTKNRVKWISCFPIPLRRALSDTAIPITSASSSECFRTIMPASFTSVSSSVRLEIFSQSGKAIRESFMVTRKGRLLVFSRAARI